jgi:ribosomal protein S28E/S33
MERVDPAATGVFGISRRSKPGVEHAALLQIWQETGKKGAMATTQQQVEVNITGVDPGRILIRNANNHLAIF